MSIDRELPFLYACLSLLTVSNYLVMDSSIWKIGIGLSSRPSLKAIAFPAGVLENTEK